MNGLGSNTFIPSTVCVHPDTPHRRPCTSRSSRINEPSGAANLPVAIQHARGNDVRWRYPCMKASANVPSDPVDARICIMTLMDAPSGVGQLRSMSCMSGFLEPCTPHRALATCPLSFSFQRSTVLNEITCCCSCYPIVAASCGMTVTVWSPSTPFHSVSEVLQNVSLSFSF